MDHKHVPSPLKKTALPRFALLGCALAAAVSLTACNPKEEAGSTGEPTAAPTAATAATAAPTEAPTAADPTQAGGPTGAPGADDPGTYPAIGWVNADELRIRPEPNTDKWPIGGLKEGEQVTVLGKEGDWYKIQFKKDQPGYVSAQFIQFSKHVPSPTEAAAATTGVTAGTTTA